MIQLTEAPQDRKIALTFDKNAKINLSFGLARLLQAIQINGIELSSMRLNLEWSDKGFITLSLNVVKINKIDDPFKLFDGEKELEFTKRVILNEKNLDFDLVQKKMMQFEEDIHSESLDIGQKRKASWSFENWEGELLLSIPVKK